MKKIVRQETEEDFFARMTSLAQKLDRREPVETSDSISFEDHDEMKAFQAAQEKEERKTPLTLIAGGGKGKLKAKDLHSSLTVFRRFRNARWQNASVTFERDAKKIVRNYTAKVDLSAAGLIVITALRSEADRAPLILREK
ncbi:hypothetical protein HX867_16220 [Pseudomonas gingeri]|uniref:hypothetical protein n=1 Tax=Pseudomonas gingeri TaxID=117681 RepID=UPI0015A1FA10|nr:hypothetical protein [Pseudomonas gingeri]NVZ63641.1 hypothetical protein [Pseudomonas gingeri]